MLKDGVGTWGGLSFSRFRLLLETWQHKEVWGRMDVLWCLCGHVTLQCSLALPSSRSQSAAVTPSSTTSSTRATPAPSAPAAASATSPSPAPSSGDGASTAASPAQPIQLSDLQSILATMSVPAGPGGGQQGNTELLPLPLSPHLTSPHHARKFHS